MIKTQLVACVKRIEIGFFFLFLNSKCISFCYLSDIFMKVLVFIHIREMVWLKKKLRHVLNVARAIKS